MTDGARRDRLDARRPTCATPAASARSSTGWPRPAACTSTATPTSGSGRSTTSTGSGARAPSGRACAGTTSPTSALARAGDAGRAVVPGRHAQLRRARAAPRSTTRPDDVAVVAAQPDPCRRPSSRGRELADAVARCRAGLRAPRRQRGRPGRRLSCPTSPRRIVAFLATASLGAIWSSCAPEFGTRSVVDRFAQIEPTVLFAVDGYRYGDEGRRQARRGRGDRGRAADAAPHRARPVPRSRMTAPTTGATLLAEPGPLEFDAGAVRPPAVRALQLGHDRAAEGDRARPRRHHRRAPQDHRAAPRPRRRRPLLLVHHHRLDDVELPGVRPARRRDDRAVRRRPGVPRSRRAVAARGRHRRRRVRRERAVPHGVPQGRRRAAAASAAQHRLDRRAAAARRVPLGARRRRRATCRPRR